MIRYWASVDEDGTVDGLFRMAVDDDAKTLVMERFDGSGWVDDPDSLAETREPGVSEVNAAEADAFEQTLRDGRAEQEAADAEQQDAALADG